MLICQLACINFVLREVSTVRGTEKRLLYIAGTRAEQGRSKSQVASGWIPVPKFMTSLEDPVQSLSNNHPDCSNQAPKQIFTILQPVGETASKAYDFVLFYRYTAMRVSGRVGLHLSKYFMHRLIDKGTLLALPTPASPGNSFNQQCRTAPNKHREL